MRRRSWLGIASGVLASGVLFTSACEVSRPEGEYTPEARDASVAGTFGNSDGGTSSADAQPVETTFDSGFIDLGGGGGGGTDGGGGGGTVDPTALRLNKLSGVYLMRIDVFTSASATAAFTTVTSRARASYLFLVQLGLQADLSLAGFERFCYLNFAASCKANNRSCTIRSVVADQSIAIAQAMEPVRRVYEVDGQSVHGQSVSVRLGWNPGPDDATGVVNNSDAVWDPIPGENKEGMYLNLSYTGDPSNTNCYAHTVTRLVSEFDGMLGGTDDEPTLSGASIDGSTDGTTAKTLYISGGLGCDANGDAAPPERTEIYFKRVDDLTSAGGACPPATRWDEELPPTPPASL